jgi:hypothetical protein
VSAQDEALSDFFGDLMQLAADAQRRLTGRGLARGGSEALAMAVEAGLPPQMAYSVEQTSSYTGVPKSTLYAEHDAWRIEFICPRDKQKGYLVRVEEVDRWMKENAR